MRVYAIGNVAYDFFLEHHLEPNIDYLHAIDMPHLQEARKLSWELCRLFIEGEVDQVFVFYSHLINSMNCQPMVARLLPVRVSDFPDVPLPDSLQAGSLFFEPAPARVLERLIPQYVIGSVYATLIQSFASEQCARMAAMDTATRNADEILSDLRLAYNRERQSSITQEITEIMGGLLEGGV